MNFHQNFWNFSQKHSYFLWFSNLSWKVLNFPASWCKFSNIFIKIFQHFLQTFHNFHHFFQKFPIFSMFFLSFKFFHHKILKFFKFSKFLKFLSTIFDFLKIFQGVVTLKNPKKSKNPTLIDIFFQNPSKISYYLIAI
jgi:hypothetical protein